MCCATQRKERLTPGPCNCAMFILRLGQTIHGQEVTMVQRNQRGLPLPGARRCTSNSTEFPKLKLTMSFGAFCGPNKGSLSLCQRIHELGPEYRFKFPPVGTSLLAHQGDKRGATLLHKPRTPWQMASLLCGLTAAPYTGMNTDSRALA